jgi:hypothetical protein
MSVDVRNLRRVAGASAAVTMAMQAATAVVAVRRDFSQPPSSRSGLKKWVSAGVTGQVRLS